ncbi:MAG: hypothetical protein ACJ76X_02660 [Solirubrobacteraceae bacterium]
MLRGITISFEPGGIALLPDCATDASEHDSTARVSGLCCFGMTTVLTPGFCRAVATGSELELLLLPQPVIAATAAHITVTATTRFAAERELLMVSSVGWPGYKPIVFWMRLSARFDASCAQVLPRHHSVLTCQETAI